jgi:dTDP-4-dehydrorhamnose reductase
MADGLFGNVSLWKETPVKIAVTGAAGLFGKGLAQVFREKNEVSPLTRQEGDLTDHARMRELLNEIKPDVIVHPGGIADVDECERNPELAFRVNTEATKNLVEIAKDLGARFAFVSTDAVFDGKADRPYVETDPVNPPSVYGRTKVAAEDSVRQYARHDIFRVSVLFGPGKANFVNKGLCKAWGKEQYIVVSDQLGNATYTIDAARTMLHVFEAEANGTFHLCNQGECTRYELAKRAVELAGLDSSIVVGKPMAEMNRPGPRLKYSVMEMRALRNAEIALPRSWEDALEEYVQTLRAVG